MNFVDPIRDIKVINKMKKRMLKDNKIREYTLFVIGINSGLRISDILNLKWSDVCDKRYKLKSTIVLKEKKTSKTKKFPLNESAKEALNRLIKGTEDIDHDDFVFRSLSNKVKNENKPWGRQYVWDFLKTYARLSDFDGIIGTHTLRKTFGYHAYSNGVSLELIQKIFNHSSPSVTLRYIGITQQEIDDVYLNIVNL